MTHAKKRGLCWLIAAVMTAALMIFVLTSTDMLYATNDDAGIMHARVAPWVAPNWALSTWPI